VSVEETRLSRLLTSIDWATTATALVRTRHAAAPIAKRFIANLLM
jgi:hypothetical protein